jgi:hypothetical protein
MARDRMALVHSAAGDAEERARDAWRNGRVDECAAVAASVDEPTFALAVLRVRTALARREHDRAMMAAAALRPSGAHEQSLAALLQAIVHVRLKQDAEALRLLNDIVASVPARNVLLEASYYAARVHARGRTFDVAQRFVDATLAGVGTSDDHGSLFDVDPALPAKVHYFAGLLAVANERRSLAEGELHFSQALYLEPFARAAWLRAQVIAALAVLFSQAEHPSAESIERLAQNAQTIADGHANQRGAALRALAMGYERLDRRADAGSLYALAQSPAGSSQAIAACAAAATLARRAGDLLSAAMFLTTACTQAQQTQHLAPEALLELALACARSGNAQAATTWLDAYTQTRSAASVHWASRSFLETLERHARAVTRTAEQFYEEMGAAYVELANVATAWRTMGYFGRALEATSEVALLSGGQQIGPVGAGTSGDRDLRSVTLSRSRRPIFEGLVRFQSPQNIAKEQMLTAGYVRKLAGDIYAHFGVAGHVELLSVVYRHIVDPQKPQIRIEWSGSDE